MIYGHVNDLQKNFLVIACLLIEQRSLHVGPDHNSMSVELDHYFVNLQTYSSQMSPLHMASRNNYIDLSKVLLNAGAKLDAKDSDGKVNTVAIQGQKV